MRFRFVSRRADFGDHDTDLKRVVSRRSSCCYIYQPKPTKLAAQRQAREWERGQRVGQGVFRRLAAEGDRADARRATKVVLERLRERRRLRSVFGAIVQQLVRDAEAASAAASAAGRARKRGAGEALGDASSGRVTRSRTAAERGAKRGADRGLAGGGPSAKRVRGAYGGGEGGSSRGGGYRT